MRGFTLIELVIVIAIVGILASITIGLYAKKEEAEAKAHCEAWLAGEYYESSGYEESLLIEVCGEQE